MKSLRLMFAFAAGALLAPLAVTLVASPAPDYLSMERESVLTRIVDLLEARRASGTADLDEIAKARLKLHTFRRDAATTVSGKIRQQELIVELLTKQYQLQLTRWDAGLADELVLLRSADSVLAARQLLTELKARESKD